MNDAAAHTWTDITVATVLGLSAIVTSWCGYQAVRWSGHQAASYNQADTLRSASNRAAALANNERAIDVDMFLNWLRATAEERVVLADFYRVRFRPELRVAFERWVASKPMLNPSAPLSPFSLPEYRLAKDQEAQQLTGQAEAATADATAANEQGDRYQLLTVMFSAVLFFAGMTSTLRFPLVRKVSLVVSVVVLLWGMAVLVRYPIE